ncbi:MAG: enoyl-CoA hydratase/isomerase family protein [Acidobacteria bacterium]|nr:enoyl-CoA hydratase/isomerase family protein [Acidobacteriota bacterium]
MEAVELVSLSSTGDAARLVMRRPPLNFLNLDLLKRFEQHLNSFGDDPACRALVVASEMPAFCAGLEMAEQTREGIFLLLEQFHNVVRTLSEFPRPTIALVRGMALGAGNELAACCDFVYASEAASFGQPEVKIGTIPSVGHILLPLLVGSRRASELILTGSIISAGEAAAMGLVTRLVPDDQLDKAAEDTINLFQGLSKPVVALALQGVRDLRNREIEGRLRQAESVYLNQLMDLKDTAEGIRAFLEKRTPRWKDH